MATQKKVIKKVIKHTEDDKILGIAPKVEEIIEIVDYTSPKMKYKVSNLALNNKPVVLNGACIETFIGSGNAQARADLKAGKKEVITKDHAGQPMYKIEVID